MYSEKLDLYKQVSDEKNAQMQQSMLQLQESSNEKIAQMQQSSNEKIAQMQQSHEQSHTITQVPKKMILPCEFREVVRTSSGVDDTLKLSDRC